MLEPDSSSGALQQGNLTSANPFRKHQLRVISGQCFNQL